MWIYLKLEVYSGFLDSSNAVPGAVQEGLVGSSGASSYVLCKSFTLVSLSIAITYLEQFKKGWSTVVMEAVS